MQQRFEFRGSNSGPWRVLSHRTVTGEPIAVTTHIAVTTASPDIACSSGWVVQGTISNVRYATRPEIIELKAKQEPLGRGEARRAAFIPIKKSAAWWELAQDERRAIFEETSHHTAIGMDYLPRIARQLYHCRDLGQPFDFVT